MMESDSRGLFLDNLHIRSTESTPVFLRDLTLCLDESGYRTPEVCAGRYDAKKSAQSVLALHRRLNQDAVVGCVHHVGMDIEALGGEMSYADYGIPSITKHPFQEMPESLPEPDMLGQLPQVLESYRLVSHGLRGKAALVCNLEGPVTKAALLRGMENLAMDMELQPDLAHEVVRFAIEQGKLFIEGVSEASSPDAVFFASATDNPDILGIENVMRHSIPGLRSLVAKARSLDMLTVFHPHGDLSHDRNADLLEAMLASGIDGFQFAEGNDAVKIRETLRERVCIMGGIDAFTTLLLGPDARITEETESFLDTFQGCRWYVFMCSCSLHRGMPLSNVDVLMGSVRSFVP